MPGECPLGKIPLRLTMENRLNMNGIITRIIELAGWVVLGVSAILLGFATHIDNYQPPEPAAVAQAK